MNIAKHSNSVTSQAFVQSARASICSYYLYQIGSNDNMSFFLNNNVTCKESNSLARLDVSLKDVAVDSTSGISSASQTCKFFFIDYI